MSAARQGAGSSDAPTKARFVPTVLRHALVALWQTRAGLTPRRRRRSLAARQARLACERLGPSFVKLAQLASVRPDLFAPEVIVELERLQDAVPAVGVDAIRATIARELGRAPEAVFASFDPRPLAAASIAQVHAATLREAYRPVVGPVLSAGSPVAVKVVRPGVEASIAADLRAARRWAHALARLPRVARYGPEALLDELSASLARELDLRHEGRVADRFVHAFADDPLVSAPRVVWRHTTRRVLTTELVDGWRLSELDAARSAGIDTAALAAHGAQVFLRQVLEVGTFHADLHPANLFVTRDGRLCYLDFGIVGTTTPAQREAIAHVLVALAYGDAERALRASRRLGLEVGDDRVGAVRDGVAVLTSRHLRREPSDLRGFALGFLALLRDQRVRIPSGYGLLIKALVTVEGVARSLAPDVDVIRSGAPYVSGLLVRELSRPERLRASLPRALSAALREMVA